MAEANVNVNRSDPYKNFNFRVELVALRTTRDSVDLPVETLADEAFVRRLRFMIDFPSPSAA